MKKIITLICVAALALSFACDASSQEVYAQRQKKTYRQTVVYASLGAMANLSASDFGVGAAVGVRNYNREAIVSFAPSIEAFLNNYICYH